METIPESTPGSNPKEEVLPPKIEDKTPVTEKSSELIDILSRIKSYNWITKGFSINKEINSDYASVNITLGK